MIRAGDKVSIKRAWQDKGADAITFRAVEDEDGGRVLVVAELGLTINPTQVIRVDMVVKACDFCGELAVQRETRR